MMSPFYDASAFIGEILGFIFREYVEVDGSQPSLFFTLKTIIYNFT